jgi:hypothetical protein
LALGSQLLKSFLAIGHNMADFHFFTLKKEEIATYLTISKSLGAVGGEWIPREGVNTGSCCTFVIMT